MDRGVILTNYNYYTTNDLGTLDLNALVFDICIHRSELFYVEGSLY